MGGGSYALEIQVGGGSYALEIQVGGGSYALEIQVGGGSYALEIQVGGGSYALEIQMGGGVKEVWKSRWKGGGGSNNVAIWEGVDFFWNNSFPKICLIKF